MNGVNKLACGFVLSFAVALGTVSARADNNWTYLAAGSDGNPSADYPCIVQGEWVLLANSLWALGNDIPNGKYRVGRPLAWPADGVLDLRNMSISGYPGTDGAVAVTNLTFGNNSNDQYGGNPCASDSPIVELYASHIAGPGLTSPWHNTSDNLRRVWFESDYITSFGGYFPSCTNVVLRFPNWTTIPQTATLRTGTGTSAATLSGNDISDVMPPWLQNLDGGVQLSGMTGTLVLTNMQSLGQSSTGFIPPTTEKAQITFKGTSLGNTQFFRGAGALKDVELIAPACTNFAFQSASWAWIGIAFTNVTLDIPKAEATIAWPVANADIWFQSEALPLSVVQTMCEKMTKNSIPKYRKIYCSKRMGWKALAAEMTDDEKAVAPAGCFGVLVGSDGGRRAWIVHRDSPNEKLTGTVYYLR